jgi:outer membrane protein TolC
MSKGYLQALASYKSNLAVYNMTQKNIDIARDIYKTVMFQYNEGIKTYLEVIISETDLLTAQINNLSALILLMYSKIDVQQALGKISVNY